MVQELTLIQDKTGRVHDLIADGINLGKLGITSYKINCEAPNFENELVIKFRLKKIFTSNEEI